jgi:hypothetical protein
VISNHKNSSQANVCSEQEFEKLLRRSEERRKSQLSSALNPGAPKSNALKIVPPIQRRRDSAA